MLDYDNSLVLGCITGIFFPSKNFLVFPFSICHNLRYLGFMCASKF